MIENGGVFLYQGNTDRAQAVATAGKTIRPGPAARTARLTPPVGQQIPGQRPDSRSWTGRTGRFCLCTLLVHLLATALIRYCAA